MSININHVERVQAYIKVVFEEQVPQTLTYLENVFTGKSKEIYTCITNEDVKYTILVGLGKEDELTMETVRAAMAKAAKQARDLKAETVSVELPVAKSLTEEQVAIATTEGISLAMYTFNKYKSDNKEALEPAFHLANVQDEALVEAIIKERTNLASGICIARNLINEPANVMYPETLAEAAKEAGAEAGFEVEVLQVPAMEHIGMHAMLAVGNGSEKKPRLIVMRYMNGGDSEVIGLVGKGLTTDTGGYSLKSSDSMYYMKSDMSGGANMIGTMFALAKNKVKKNVIAVVPACENVISGCSYKIGDVLQTMAGKTIEVLNTDAEGRLALADALTYIIRKEKVDKIIDMATLTGMAGATFGNIYTASLSNNDAFYEQFMKAADVAEEKFWRLPNHKDYRSIINSDVADMKNTGGAGTITAAIFLQEFVEDKPWIHLDIAATACTNPPVHDYEFKGGTGVAIRTLYTLIKG